MMTPDPESANLTELLGLIREGNTSARDQFTILVYGKLKELARAKMRHERIDHTAQPTVLVHEAYLRIFGATPMKFADRTHFYRVAAMEMRRYLFDCARARNGPRRRRDLAVSLEEELAASPETANLDIVIHDLLDRLEKNDPGGAEVVELKFYGGMTYEEIAECLNLPVITVRRRWHSALVWLMSHHNAGAKK